MKIPVRITQFIVGILFIISGLVKANDPMGLGYKMQEFFEVWNADLNAGTFFARQFLVSCFDFLHEHSLFLSVSMITLEIVAGVALLVGWKKKFILYLLLFLIVFFTFLTGYAFLSKNPNGSPKFTNCGCFGDCLPITPQVSFLKDLALLILIIFLLLGQRYIQPVLSRNFRAGVLSLSLFLSLLFQWYVLTYLPVVDCLPFKKKNNLAEKMKAPPGSIPDSLAIRYIYEKGGKRYEWAPEDLPADFETYTYINRVDRLVRKGNAEPAIKGFSLTDTSGQDLTNMVLNDSVAVIVFALDDKDPGKWLPDLKELAGVSVQKNIPVYFATSARDRYLELFNRQKLPIPVFSCDYTVIRTAARTNPTAYILRKGTVVDKFSKRQLIKATEEIRKL